jgi:hypothetical protein
MAGIVRDLPNSIYHSMAEAISNTGLNDFMKSPAHYFSRHLDPARPPKKSRPGQLEGTLAHCALFEPYEFDRRYQVGPDVSKQTKEWKEFAADAARRNREAITQEQKDTALIQAKEARSVPSVASALALGHAEVSVFWIDENTGVRCRARPDWVHPCTTPAGNGVILLDGKTYSDADPWEFAKQIERKGYDRQAAFYSDGYEAATGTEVVAFVFVCMETEWPFKSAALMMTPDDIEVGREKYRNQLSRLAECQKTNVWPGYADDIYKVTVPRSRRR